MMISIVICAFTLPTTVALAPRVSSLAAHAAMSGHKYDPSHDHLVPGETEGGDAESEPEREPQPEPEPDDDDDELVGAALVRTASAAESSFASWLHSHLFVSRAAERLLRPPIS